MSTTPIAQGRVISSNMPTEPDWPSFWTDFRTYADWRLQWHDGDQWVNVNEDLTVIREYPQPNAVKLTLVFDASHAGDYRLVFAIDKSVRDSITRLDQYQYSLTFDELSLTFDWSDAIAIPGVEFNHGLLDDRFWFTISRDNVPLGAHVEIDPIIVIDSYTGGAGTSRALSIDHPSTLNNRFSAAGQTFNSTEKFTLVNATFRLWKVGNPTGTAHAVVYLTQGTAGVDATPTGSALAVSDDFDISTLGGAAASYNFTFSGANQIVCQANTDYCVIFQLDDAVVIDGAVNYVRIQTETVASADDGNCIDYDNSAWNSYAAAARGTYFIIYGDSFWNDIADLIDQAFEYFNILDYMSQITTFVDSLTTWFSSSLTRALELVTLQFTIITEVYSWVLYWATAMVGIVIDFSEFYHQLLDGTSAWSNALAPWWNLVTTGIGIAPLVFFIAWLDSIVMREMRTGQSGITIFIDDLNTAVNIVSYLFGLFSYVLNTVIDNTYRLFEAII